MAYAAALHAPLVEPLVGPLNGPVPGLPLHSPTTCRPVGAPIADGGAAIQRYGADLGLAAAASVDAVSIGETPRYLPAALTATNGPPAHRRSHLPQSQQQHHQQQQLQQRQLLLRQQQLQQLQQPQQQLQLQHQQQHQHPHQLQHDPLLLQQHQLLLPGQQLLLPTQPQPWQRQLRHASATGQQTTPPQQPSPLPSANGLASAVSWDAYTTGRTAYYMEAGDPNPVLLAQPDGPAGAPVLSKQTAAASAILRTQPPPAGMGASSVALGIVTMTKKPFDLPTWLEYHHEKVGVRRFYIKVEDTPELAVLFATPPWDTLVVPVFDDHTQRDYFAQMDRQASHIAAMLPRARADGLTHLLHIDDDELLYCAHGTHVLYEELAAAPSSRPDCHLCNIEALLPHDACASPFREATVFRHFPTRYVSYTNGKSIGRLEEPTLRAHGPHHFRNDSAAGGSQSTITFPIGPEIACVLHYESATYAKWHQKYLELAARHGADPDVYARVPFAFYRASMVAASAILAARAAQDLAAEAEAVAAAHKLWCEHKLAPAGLPAPVARPRVLSNGLSILNPFLS